MLLSDLPLDALTSILKFLAPRDLVAVGLTCFRLAEAANQEALWANLCSSWVSKQPEAAGMIDLDGLQRSLEVRTSRHIYQVLHSLGAWPVGVWYCTSEEACRPHGEVLVIEPISRNILTGSRVVAGPVPNPPIDQENAWEYDVWFKIQVGPRMVVSLEHDAKGILSAVNDAECFPMVAWFPAQDLGNSLIVHENGEELVVYRGYRPDEINSRPNARLLTGSWLAAPAPERQELRYQRLSLGWRSGNQPALGPPALMPAGRPGANGLAFDGVAVLQRLEGVFTACYGPHGLEILRLGMAGPEEPPPPGCGIMGPRLQAFKITGDPNVDALRYSFVVDAAQGRVGRYDPHQDDPFPLPGGLPRMVLAFYEAATLVVHLEQRPAVARFRAQGQINATPGVWDPQFVAATLVVYEEGYHIPFTVIFEDEGVHVRHAMDFFPFTLLDPSQSDDEEEEEQQPMDG